MAAILTGRFPRVS